MKFFSFFLLLMLISAFAYSQNSGSSSMRADPILDKVSQKLSSLKKIRYTNIRELNYSSENYRNISNWSVYYDFQRNDTLTGFRYQIEDSVLKQVFNGTEKFDLNKKARTIQINDRPDKKSFSSISALYNSISTLKNVLPLLINDKTAIKAVADTTINNTPYILITVNIGKRRIQNSGRGFDVMTTKNNFIYKIIINRNSNLPAAVLQVNDLNNDFIQTSFANIETDAAALPELSWYYSTYTNDFKPAAEKAVPQLLSRGSSAPEWELQSYNKNEAVSLSDLKGKVILLDFWIKNCGPCIQSVPHLNELQHKFKDRDFKIISINSYDSREEVSWFCTKHNADYPVFLNGKPVAEKYGVSGFPAFFVIDKEGKIVYANTGYNASIQSELEQLIEHAL